MIELHFHCLPGVDDGPRSWDESVALCRAAHDDGVTRIVATPHVLRYPWLNEDQEVRRELIGQLNQRLSGRPEILVGCEYHVSSDAVELWRQGNAGPLAGLNGSRFILIEFSASALPRDAEAVVYEMSLAGATPVIAHPERNHVFTADPGRLQRMIDLGALTQVTAGSITGSFGRAVQAAASVMFERRLVHVVASDAHSIDRRPPMLSLARRTVREKWGANVEAAVFEANPEAIVANGVVASVFSDR